MKNVTAVLRDGLRLSLKVLPPYVYSLERGVREGEGIFRGTDADGVDVTVACRYVQAYSVEDVEEPKVETEDEKDEEDCNS